MTKGIQTTLYLKLLEIRKAVEYMQKTERGNQGAMYVDPAVLLKIIRGKMNECGVLLMPNLKDCNVSEIAAPTAKNPNNKGFLFVSDMDYVFVDAETGEQERVSWFVTGNHMQDPSMAMGGALTYAERYFLLKFFQIPTSKDDPEYFNQKTKAQEPAPKVSIGHENVAWLMAFCKRHNIQDKQEFQKNYSFNVYQTKAEDFELIKSKMQADYNEL